MGKWLDYVLAHDEVGSCRPGEIVRLGQVEYVFHEGFNRLEEGGGEEMATRLGKLIVQSHEPRQCQPSRARNAEPRWQDRQVSLRDLRARQLCRAADR